MADYKTISVQGNIAVGKTSFLRYCETKFGDKIECFPEPVEEWRNVNGFNLLEEFYKNPLKNSMVFQSYVQLTMLKLHQKKPKTTSVNVKLMERSIHTCTEVFIPNQVKNSMLSLLEESVLKKWYDHFIESNQEVKLDGIIYLRADPEVCLQRIKIRRRKEEEMVDLNYLHQLHTLHENWLNPIDGNKDLRIHLIDANVEMRNGVVREYDDLIEKIISNRSGLY